MKHPVLASIVVAAVVGLAGCNSDSNSPPGTGQLRVVNAIPDSAPIDATLQDAATGSTSNTEYQADSGFVDVPIGSYKVQVTATPSGGGSASEFTLDNVSIDHNNQTTVYAIGKLSDDSAAAVAVEENVENKPASDKVGLQFVNATTANAVNGTVYLVAPGDTVDNAVYSTTLTAPSAGSTTFYSAPTTQTAAAYEVIVQVGGVTVYDSGATTGITFPGGGNFQVAILDATTAQITSNTSPVVLVVLNNEDGSQATYLAGSNGTAGS